MIQDPKRDEIDALIATLDAARASWNRMSGATVRRVAAHAAAIGVVVDLPLSDDLVAVDEMIRRLSLARGSAEGKTQILIVEDDKLTAQVLADTLRTADRDVHIASNAADAVKYIREHEVGLIILDLVLPDADGRDLLTRIRSTPATRATPVIVVTARSDAVSQAECFALGADALLNKPVEPAVLLAAVAAHLAHAAQRRLEGRIDTLTMLPNRAAFLDALSRATPFAQRNNQPLALAMIDLDHFKSVNDTYGHGMGDEVLQTCAREIARALRTTDYVARWGGEELCAFFPNTTTRGAAIALGKALEAVRTLPFVSNGRVFSVTFSAGLASLEPGGSQQKLLEEADRLLYVAKNSGRNRIISRLDEADPPRPRALLVEDDEAVASVVCRLLEREGFDVAHFHQGDGVISAAEHEHFSVAVIDLALPDADGFDIVERLRTLPAAAKMPILMLTASGEEDDVVRGFAVGANDYLIKPFHARELVARVNRMLPRR